VKVRVRRSPLRTNSAVLQGRRATPADGIQTLFLVVDWNGGPMGSRSVPVRVNLLDRRAHLRLAEAVAQFGRVHARRGACSELLAGSCRVSLRGRGHNCVRGFDDEAMGFGGASAREGWPLVPESARRWTLGAAVRSRDPRRGLCGGVGRNRTRLGDASGGAGCGWAAQRANLWSAERGRGHRGGGAGGRAAAESALRESDLRAWRQYGLAGRRAAEATWLWVARGGDLGRPWRGVGGRRLPRDERASSDADRAFRRPRLGDRPQPEPGPAGKSGRRRSRPEPPGLGGRRVSNRRLYDHCRRCEDR